MFREVLFNTIKDNFSLVAFPTLTFYYGTVPDDVKQPYIAMYSLDTDGDSQYLCNKNDYTDGNDFLQWNISTLSISNSDYIQEELHKYIGQLKSVEYNGTKHMIQLNNKESSPSGLEDNNNLFTSIVSRSFTYNKEI